MHNGCVVGVNLEAIPVRRFRSIVEYDKWNRSGYDSQFEVPEHIPDGKGGIKANPEFETAPLELSYREVKNE